MANLLIPGAKIDPADLVLPRGQIRYLYHIRNLLADERGFFPGYTEAVAAIEALNRLYILDIAIPRQKKEMLSDALHHIREAIDLLESAAEAIAIAQQGE